MTDGRETDLAHGGHVLPAPHADIPLFRRLRFRQPLFGRVSNVDRSLLRLIAVQTVDFTSLQGNDAIRMQVI